MADSDRAGIAHLMRRTGFGATHDELDDYAVMGYQAVVENLLHPERSPEVEEDLLRRYWDGESIQMAASSWLYRMVITRRPLEEKIALFWHHVFATGYQKGEHTPSMVRQIEMFRCVGLSSMREILTDLSQDPAMIFWLDNNENHKNEPNENYGRELLELFSMGVGNYTEQDIKTVARSFTGWTFTQPIPIYPYGHHTPQFVYREDDHDDGVKTFLGEQGRFNGEDIIEIIARQPATAQFVSRHLYNFFVADEPPVPSWSIEPAKDSEAVSVMANSYLESDGNIASILRVMFNSDFFKEARFKKVKCPAELVAGTIKLAGASRLPERDLLELDTATTAMGQQLYNPPTVEGWHTGHEWIDGGTLNERVNFSVNELADATKPGIASFIDRMAAAGGPLSPDDFVDRCLDLVGPLQVDDLTRRSLLRHAESGGPLAFDTESQREKSSARVCRMLQLVVSTREYQFA